MNLLKVITVSALILTIGALGDAKTADYYREDVSQQTGNPSYTPTPLEVYLINWELGEEILPYPFFDHWFDCDDATVYSFLYLRSVDRDLDVKIMAGRAWGEEHTWLEVSDNSTMVIYDWGIPIENTTLYKGREISYGQLIYYIEDDL